MALGRVRENDGAGAISVVAVAASTLRMSRMWCAAISSWIELSTTRASGMRENTRSTPIARMSLATSSGLRCSMAAEFRWRRRCGSGSRCASYRLEAQSRYRLRPAERKGHSPPSLPHAHARCLPRCRRYQRQERLNRHDASPARANSGAATLTAHPVIRVERRSRHLSSSPLSLLLKQILTDRRRKQVRAWNLMVLRSEFSVNSPPPTHQ